MIASIIISQKLAKKVQQIFIFVEATGFDRKEDNKNLNFPCSFEEIYFNCVEF